MQSVKNLIRTANPIPEPRSAALSERAERELAALIATKPEATRVPRRPWYEALRVRRVRFAVAGAVAAIALAGTVVQLARPDSGQQPGVSWEPLFRDTRSLEGKADMIVRAAVRSTRVELRNGMSQTVASATVVSVAKGSATVGGNIEFAYMTPGDNADAVSDVKPGGEYVMLLENRSGEPPFVVNSYQGYYTVVDDRAVPNPANDVDLSAKVKKELELK